MEITAVVLYKGALTHYSVKLKKDGSYEAGLLKYNGTAGTLPPLRIQFKKEGRHCIGDTDEQELMDDICHAVQTKLNPVDGSGITINRTNMTYVSI